MAIQMEASWLKQLSPEFEKDYFKNLIGFVRSEYKQAVCYPPGKLIFNAFEKCPFDTTRVVILGQDPYHGIGQANGLCFSVNDGIEQPPSLQNIFKEIQQDLDKAIPRSGNLERWATQGVLLLNATLTVRANQAGSHQNKGWEQFTDAVVRLLDAEKENLVFMLWGRYAQEKGKMINTNKHFVLRASHPSPLSANRGGWFGTKHFSQANNYLKAKGLAEIEW